MKRLFVFLQLLTCTSMADANLEAYALQCMATPHTYKYEFPGAFMNPRSWLNAKYEMILETTPNAKPLNSNNFKLKTNWGIDRELTINVTHAIFYNNDFLIKNHATVCNDILGWERNSCADKIKYVIEIAQWAKLYEDDREKGYALDCLILNLTLMKQHLRRI